MLEPTKTTITLDTGYHKITVSVPRLDLTMPDTFELLIEPALLGAGYSQKTIDGYFDSNKPETKT